MLAQTSLPTKFDLTSLKSVMTTGGVVSSTIRMTLMDRLERKSILFH